MDAQKAAGATGIIDLDEAASGDLEQQFALPLCDQDPGPEDAGPLIRCLDEFAPPFTIIEPQVQVAPFIFSSPHSGRKYPKAFLEASTLDALSLRRSEDSFVDEIFADAPRLGVPFLCAEFPRAFLDVNREPFELDPLMFKEPLPTYVNTRSRRVASGLGTIARVVSDGRNIYRNKLTLADALERIDRLHRPYHEALGNLVDATRARFGAACLIDCHSMPSSSSSIGYGGRCRNRADIILGNRHGTSCSPLIIEEAERVLQDCGYKVTRNEPFAGGYCTQRFGRPAKGLHSLQIEISRELYMNEATLERTEGLTRLRRNMALLVEALTSLDASDLKSPLQNRSTRRS